MIIQYIIELLKNNDDIYINDLGLFEKKQVSAQMIDGVLHPPQNKILFKSNAEGNGFAFILKYAEREQKRLNEADEEIRTWVEELKGALQHNKSIHYDNFGTFSYNHKHEIIFESDIIRELNIDYEGMSPIKTSPLHSAGTVPGTVRAEPEVTADIMVSEDKPGAEVAIEVSPAGKPGPEGLPVKEPAPDIDEEVGAVVEKSTAVPMAEVAAVIPDNSGPAGENTEKHPGPEVKPASAPEPLKVSVPEDEEVPSKKRKIRAWWFIVPAIILLLAVGIGLAYVHRVPLELTYREYVSGRKTGSSPGMRDRDVVLSPIFDYQYPEKVYEMVNVPFIPGMENSIQQEEITVTEPVQDQAPLDVKTESGTAVSASGLIKEKGSPSSTPYPRIDYQAGKYYVIAGSFTNEPDAAKHIRQANLGSYDPYLLYQPGNNRVRVCVGVFGDESKALGFAERLNKNYWVLK